MWAVDAKLSYYKPCLHSASQTLARQARAVAEAAAEEGVDPELLFAVLVLEQISRGGLPRLLERLVAKLWPGWLERRDCSLGLPQIRISTAQQVVCVSKREIIRAMMDDGRSIRVCAQLLRRYEDEHGLHSLPAKERFTSFAKLYLTGRIDTPIHPRIDIYARLLAYAKCCRLFGHLTTSVPEFPPHTPN
jgi:hypothetical protein